MPKALLVGSRPGYVMELMDGLITSGPIAGGDSKGFTEGDGLGGFVRSCGLKRRMALR